MRQNGSRATDKDLDKATVAAAWGAVNGAARWGLYFGVLGVAAYIFSPLYRGLTIQFKVFLQMSGMTLGSMLEADRRLRAYETEVRVRRRLIRDQAVWSGYEREYEAGNNDKERKRDD